MLMGIWNGTEGNKYGLLTIFPRIFSSMFICNKDVSQLFYSSDMSDKALNVGPLPKNKNLLLPKVCKKYCSSCGVAKIEQLFSYTCCP